MAHYTKRIFGIFSKIFLASGSKPFREPKTTFIQVDMGDNQSMPCGA
jgi:hypothetical protein